MEGLPLDVFHLFHVVLSVGSVERSTFGMCLVPHFFAWDPTIGPAELGELASMAAIVTFPTTFSWTKLSSEVG